MPKPRKRKKDKLSKDEKKALKAVLKALGYKKKDLDDLIPDAAERTREAIAEALIAVQKKAPKAQ